MALLNETVSLTTALVRGTDFDRSTIRNIVGSVGGITVEGGGLYSIPTLSTNHALDLGGVTTAAVLYISSDQPITVILNGSGSIPLGTDPANEPGFLLLFNTSITSVGITNNSGNAANIDFFVAGS